MNCCVKVGDKSHDDETSSVVIEPLEALKLQWQSEQDALKQRCHLVDVSQWQIERIAHLVSDDKRDCSGQAAATLHVGAQQHTEDGVENGTDDGDAGDSQGFCGGQDSCVRYVGGVDISFVKGDDVRACASFVVVELPTCKVVYEDTSLVDLTVPYIAGFLAFREAPFFIEKIGKLKNCHPELMPQAILVDGNGILHTNGFGFACHLGVMLGIPTVGVAKTLFHVDGLENNKEHHNKIESLKRAGDTFELIGDSGKLYGMALRCTNKSTKPVYVSAGHNISLDTAVWLVKLCLQYRIPEPIRQADMRSREFLRELETSTDGEAAEGGAQRSGKLNRVKPTKKKKERKDEEDDDTNQCS